MYRSLKNTPKERTNCGRRWHTMQKTYLHYSVTVEMQTQRQLDIVVWGSVLRLYCTPYALWSAFLATVTLLVEF